MKQLFILLTCCCLLSTTNLQAKSIKDFIKIAKKEQMCEKVELGGLALTFAGLFSDTYGIKSVKVYSIEHCSDKFQKEIDKILKKQQPFNDLEILVSNNEDDETTRIWAETDGKIIKQLFILNYDKSYCECELVYIKGKIDLEKLNDVTKQYNKKEKTT